MENTIAEHDALDLGLLLEKVYQDGGYDFRGYKSGTISRRLARRLCASGVSTYHEYMKYLDAHPEEYKELADDLIIKVSGFNRSPYSFRQLSSLVLPGLFSEKRARGKRGVTFWSTACARGEEPYSIAILLAEFLGTRRRDFDIKIFATDISQQALDKAEEGMYTVKDMGVGLSPEVLKEYFIQHGQYYEVRADIREMVRFSRFDLTLIDQAPFMDVDCIFCCNVLIYLQKSLQEKILDMLCDSLAASGYLVLGEAETPASGMREKLECLDSKAKIYGKVAQI